MHCHCCEQFCSIRSSVVEIVTRDQNTLELNDTFSSQQDSNLISTSAKQRVIGSLDQSKLTSQE